MVVTFDIYGKMTQKTYVARRVCDLFYSGEVVLGLGLLSVAS